MPQVFENKFVVCFDFVDDRGIADQEVFVDSSGPTGRVTIFDSQQDAQDFIVENSEELPGWLDEIVDEEVVIYEIYVCQLTRLEWADKK